MIFFKKIHYKYNIFCKFGKDDISFSYRYDITLLPKKAKLIFSRKNTLNDDISGIIEEVVIHHRKYCILFDIKIKDDKKLTFIKKFHDSLNFYGDLYRRFHILLSNEIKPRDLTMNKITKRLNIVQYY